MKAYRVREVWLHSFLTLALDGAKWSAVVVMVVTIMGQYYEMLLNVTKFKACTEVLGI